MEATRTRELIVFRLIQMPCCGQLLCWVNPRMPNNCPECGESIFVKIKESVRHLDTSAELVLNSAIPGITSTIAKDVNGEILSFSEDQEQAMIEALESTGKFDVVGRQW